MLKAESWGFLSVSFVVHYKGKHERRFLRIL